MGSVRAVARWPPSRVKFCSKPLRVAVAIVRLGPLKGAMKGPLELAQLMMARGRSWSLALAPRLLVSPCSLLFCVLFPC